MDFSYICSIINHLKNLKMSNGVITSLIMIVALCLDLYITHKVSRRYNAGALLKYKRNLYDGLCSLGLLISYEAAEYFLMDNIDYLFLSIVGTICLVEFGLSLKDYINYKKEEK